MRVKRLLPVTLIIAALIAPTAQGASDYAKEKRWAHQILESLFVGNAVLLTADNHKFLTLYTPPQTSYSKGGIILMHGMGVHPNWVDVIYPLRTQLPEHGWYTLSLQMPVLRNGAKSEAYSPLIPDSAKRIAAGVAFLQSKGIHNIVLIGHSLGTTMGAYYLAHHPSPDVHAFVGVSMSIIRFKNASRTITTSLEHIHVPILDLGGTDDPAQTPAEIHARAAAARRAGNKRYTQIEVKGADHFFHDKDAVLVRDVRTWLNQNAVK